MLFEVYFKAMMPIEIAGRDDGSKQGSAFYYTGDRYDNSNGQGIFNCGCQSELKRAKRQGQYIDHSIVREPDKILH